MAAAERAPLSDRRAAQRAADAGSRSSPTSGTGRRCARAWRSSCARARTATETFVLCRSARAAARRRRRCTSASAERIEAGLESLAAPARARREAARSRRRSSGRSAGCSSATRARPSAIVDPTRRRPDRAGGPAPATGRCAPEWDDWARAQRGLLRAAHQRHRLDARGALADLHPAHRGRGRLPHPQERPVDPARSGTRSADRVQAHILVCFLAYVLWKTLEQWQQPRRSRQQPAHPPRRARSHPERRRRAAHRRRAPRELRIRCVVRPDRAQAALLDRLGLACPNASASRPLDRRNVVPTFGR